MKEISIYKLFEQAFSSISDAGRISAVKVVDFLINFAVSVRASDIHCDPEPKGIFVRLRIDGIMEKAGLLPLSIHEEFISRLKILSGARTDLHFVPQDGRWQAQAGKNKKYNIRISFLPTYYGENAVLRLLPVGADRDYSLFELGFSLEQISALDSAMAKNHGLILITGPTGCGKTTTLHACLSKKAKEPVSVITLEDPVEYEIDGVRQVHINHSFGVTFSKGLRAALRQDPDVIMVGEIRDEETAKVAIHTALTGHLVLSTLHTNSAIEAIPRLRDMGVDEYLLASTLKLVAAQRLIRKICPDCSMEGCDKCSGKGFVGRTVLAEVLSVDPGMSNLIAKRESLDSIRKYALQGGFRSLVEDGADKVGWGVTTKEEVCSALNS